MPRQFDVVYRDGSHELILADFHERVGDNKEFVLAVGHAGEERVTSVRAGRIESIADAGAER